MRGRGGDGFRFRFARLGFGGIGWGFDCVFCCYARLDLLVLEGEDKEEGRERTVEGRAWRRRVDWVSHDWAVSR